MKKNALNVFERFAQAYFAFVNDNDERYLVRINGVTIKEVITSKDELREAIEGALAVNPKSEVEVYKVFNEDLFKEEEVETPVETEDEVVVEEAPTDVVGNPDVATATEEEVDTTEDTVEEADEAPKDLPRKANDAPEIGELDKELTKKEAKKLKKKEKKAAKKAKKAGFAPVEEWETPSEPEPVVEKVVEKKTVTKKTTTKKAVGSTQGVQQLHLETGAVIKTFDSVSHAAQALGINATNISKVTNGHRKSTGGFGWKKV